MQNTNNPIILDGLSDEQLLAMEHVDEGEDITLLGCPGCGKTKYFTTQIVLAYPQKKVLIISYNRALANATSDVINELATNRTADNFVFCNTYHGTMGSLVKQTIENDLVFLDALEFMNFAVLAQSWAFRDFDVIIFDEAQDMRQFLFDFACILKFQVCSNPDALQTILVGDDKQVLYGFYPINKADARYLLCAEKLFQQVEPLKKWWHGQLSKSFRITPQIANFVNALMPSRNIMSAKTSRITDWVTLYIADVYVDAAQIVYDIVKKHCCGRKKRPYHEIMVLCNSLNESSPAIAVVDLLVANGIPVHVDRSGVLAQANNEANEVSRKRSNTGTFSTTLNKVIFKTNCRAKGLESKRIIMLNTKELLSERHVKNQQFVTMTRAMKFLDIIQSAAYTSQEEIDTLISKLTQRDLRVIMKRPVPPHLRVRAGSTNENINSKNAINAATLFSFMDIAHTKDLLDHIDSISIIEPQEEFVDALDGDDDFYPDANDPPKNSTSSGGVDGEDDTKSQEKNMNSRNYMFAMTQSYDNNITFVNLVAICTSALQLALEFIFTNKIPVRVQQILSKIGAKMDPKYCIMRDNIHDAISAIFDNVSKQQLDIDERCEDVWKCMKHFASLALVLDAYRGYREMLHAVKNFDFIESPHIQNRLYAVCRSFSAILKVHNITNCKSELKWYHEQTGRFLHGGQPLQVAACPAVLCTSANFIIHFSNNSSISHDDKMTAIVNALVVDDIEHNTKIDSCLNNNPIMANDQISASPSENSTFRTDNSDDIKETEDEETEEKEPHVIAYVLNFCNASLSQFRLLSDATQTTIIPEDLMEEKKKAPNSNSNTEDAETHTNEDADKHIKEDSGQTHTITHEKPCIVQPHTKRQCQVVDSIPELKSSSITTLQQSDSRDLKLLKAPGLKRRNPCLFLDTAITYKMAKCSDEDTSVEFGVNQSNVDDDDAFVDRASSLLRKFAQQKQQSTYVQPSIAVIDNSEQIFTEEEF